MLSHFALFRKLPLFAAIGGSLTLLGACKKALPDRLEITETRPTFSSEAPIPESSDAMQRLGFGAQTQFRWTTPPAWLLAPGTQMRQLNFSFGPNREGECYMSMTKGREGSTVDEINRWRKQMGQTPVEAADIDALQKLDLLKRPCPLLKLEGPYTPAAGMAMGVMPSEPKPDFGLLGVVLEVPAMQAVLTIKMVGPKALVQQEEANFKSFVTSLTPVVAQETP
jgi:hypothetical protein